MRPYARTSVIIRGDWRAVNFQINTRYKEMHYFGRMIQYVKTAYLKMYLSQLEIVRINK